MKNLNVNKEIDGRRVDGNSDVWMSVGEAAVIFLRSASWLWGWFRYVCKTL